MHRMTLSAVVMFILPGLLGAQNTDAGVTYARWDGGSPAVVVPQAETALGRKIDITLEDLRVEDALKSIAKTANLRISFSEDVYAVKKRVTLVAKHVPVEQAILTVLQGTTLAHRVVSGNQVVVDGGMKEIEQGVVIGKVIHAETKQPVSGATIMVEGASNGVKTEKDGTFRISLARGEHTLQIRALGFIRQAKKIAVEDQTITIEVILEPSASVLDEVVVTGTVVATERKAITTPITVITAKDIEQRNITRIDQLLRGEVPGVIAVDPGLQIYDGIGKMEEARVYARGSSSLVGAPGSLKTYVDGVELLDPTYLGTLDPASIERIEIITGPQAATIYGSGAMGGVMQIFTKRGKGQSAPEFVLNVRYGMLQSNMSSSYTPSHNHSLQASGGNGPVFSYSGNLSYNYQGQWQPGLFSRTSGASFGITHANGPLTISGSVSLTANRNGISGGGVYAYCSSQWTGCPVAFSHKNLYEDGTYDRSQLYSPASFISTSVASSSTHTQSLNVDYRVNQNWQHHVTLGRSATDLATNRESPSYRSSSDTLFVSRERKGSRATAGYNSTALARLGFVTVNATVGVNRSWGDQTEVYGFLVSKTATRFLDESSRAPTVTKPLDSKSLGGFTSLNIGLFEQLYVTGGMRVEKNPAYGRDHKIDWTPTTGIAYTFEHDVLTLKLLASYGSATRAPNSERRLAVVQTNPSVEPTQYVSQLENPNLTPEYSRGGQGGFELYFGNRGSITVNHFVQKIDALIFPLTADSVLLHPLSGADPWWSKITKWANVMKMRQHGWESTGSLTFGPISLKGTYSWSDSRVTSTLPPTHWGGVSFSTGQSMTFIPTHTGNVTAVYATGPTSFTFVMNYVGSSLSGGWMTATAMLGQFARLPMYESPRLGRSWPQISAPGYVKSDLSLSHRVTSWSSVMVNITNIGDHYGSDVGPIWPSLGRKTLLGVSIRR